MTYGSLFSGIGGLDLGLERSGMSCIWQCEREPFCRKILAKHWPGVKCYEDVREIDETAEVPDLLCGGFPCQPHSVAGKRKGADDERNLWPECIRLVRLLRPRWCLFENVPGLLTTMFGQVCDELRGESYEVWPLVLGADDVGAPHRRKRLWFLANNRSQKPNGIPQPERRFKGFEVGKSGSSLAKSNGRRGGSEAGNAKHEGRGASQSGRESIQTSAKRRTSAAISDVGAASEHEMANASIKGLEGQRNGKISERTKQSLSSCDCTELVHAESAESERGESRQAWLPRWRTMKTTAEERKYFLGILRPLSARANAFADAILDDLEEAEKRTGTTQRQTDSGTVTHCNACGNVVSATTIGV